MIDILGFEMTPQQVIFLVITILILLVFFKWAFHRLFSWAPKDQRGKIKKLEADKAELEAKVRTLENARTARDRELKEAHAKEIERIGKRNGSLFAKTPLKTADEICDQAVLIQGTLQGLHHSMYAMGGWYRTRTDELNIKRRQDGMPEIDNIIQMTGELKYHFENFARDMAKEVNEKNSVIEENKRLKQELSRLSTLALEAIATSDKATGTVAALRDFIFDNGLILTPPSAPAAETNTDRELRAMERGFRAANRNGGQPPKKENTGSGK